MKFVRCVFLLLGQLAATLIAAYFSCVALFAARWLYIALFWGALPALGFVSACFITVKGVNNFIAWLLPPIAGIAGHYLAFFYIPESAAPVFICALASIVGAAAGDVAKKNRSKNGGK